MFTSEAIARIVKAIKPHPAKNLEGHVYYEVGRVSHEGTEWKALCSIPIVLELDSFVYIIKREGIYQIVHPIESKSEAI